MNKKREQYVEKINKIINTVKAIGICMLILAIVISIVQYTIEKRKSNENNKKVSVNNLEYKFNINDGDIVYTSNIDLKIEIVNFEEDSNYEANIIVNDKIIDNIDKKMDKNSKFGIEFATEGKQQIEIRIKKNEDQNTNIKMNIYYINPYQKQFLDEKDTNSVQVHYIDGTWEKYDQSINLVNDCGFKNIKSSFLWNSIEKKYGVYDFSYYDEWIQKSKELGMNVFACVNRVREWRWK